MNSKKLARPVFTLLLAFIYGFFAGLELRAQTQTDIVGPTGSGTFGETVTALPNGNFVVTDSLYDDGAAADVGAVHLYNGTTNALISTLKGNTPNDRVGVEIQVLTTGDFVVMSPYWDNGSADEAGAATLCSSITGCSGVVSASNSLVGTNDLDHVSIGGISPLPGGKYTVTSYEWNNLAGAVTFCLASGCTGNVTTANSLYGDSPEDYVGLGAQTPASVVLANGNYVVSSIPYSPIDQGAVTLCNGTTGCVGTIAANNSMIGSAVFDELGISGVVALTGGDYVVGSSSWEPDGLQNYGAVTWCSGTTGCPATINSSNSLIGGTGDVIGIPVALTDGNYIVSSHRWNGARGAVTWCSATSPCVGNVTTANSLTGSAPNNEVGFPRVFALLGGKYLVNSQNWDGSAQNVGAVTLCGSGGAGCTGVTVSTANSLVGSTLNDMVGNPFSIVLPNGDYVVHSPNWNKGGIVDAGAATLCSGITGCTGTVTAANSLTGSTAGDMVGFGTHEIVGNNYIIRSPSWDGTFANVGAVTWCSGAGSCTGATVSTANSLVGSKANDNVGNSGTWAGILSNGNYIVNSTLWDNGALTNSGAITYGDGSIGIIGTINSTNSVLGQVAGGGSTMNADFDDANNRLIVSRPAENIVTLFGPASSTPTSTPTNTPTATSTNTATNTATPTYTPTATNTPTPEAVVSGTVTYGNPVTGTNPRGVPSVLIDAAGSTPLSDTTTASGTYSLTGFGAGSYTITPSKSGGQNGSITAFDAARIAQYLTGSISLTSAQAIVADVSSVGGISSFDAALIARYAASLPPPNGNSGTWLFNPVSNTHSSISSDLTDDYSALLMGDVSGNWGDPSPFRFAATWPQRLTAVTAERISAKSDGEVIVPITIQGAAEKQIIAYEFDLRYDPTVIQPKKTVVDITKSVSRVLSVVTNATEPGLLRIVVYGPIPIDENGVLLNLRFTAVGKSGSVTPLVWERFIFNEGYPQATAIDGQVELF